MLQLILGIFLAATVATAPLLAQKMEDVVRLRDGSVIRGTIIEQIPGESLKIQTQNGRVFVYTEGEIAELSREPVMETERQVGAENNNPAPKAESGGEASPAADPQSAPATCLIGEHLGFQQAEAQTAALLLCGALRKQGVSIGQPVFRPPEAGSIYRVGLHPLGQKVLVRLSHENPLGTVLIERQIQLGSIEEMVSAAPRLVDALVHRKSLASTVDMESVVEQEARIHRKIPGESFWDIGLLGTFALITDADMIAKPGYRLGWYHETPSYAVGTEFWGAGGEDNEGDSFHFVSWGIGGRYFFNKQNFSPYVGGGFSHIWAGYEQTGSKWNARRERWDHDWESEDGNGLGGYAVGGIEALRLTSVRLRLELRVDRPFFQLPNRDVMPVTLGISFSFPGGGVGGMWF